MIRVDETDPVGEVEPSFPYRDVTIRRGVEFRDHYDIESEIGRGKFGTVYRCKEKISGLGLAAKVVNTGRKEDRRSVEREVEIMRRLQHPRLIQLYDAIESGKHFYVILELIEGGELFERVIGDDFVLTERSCAVFMRQICEGMEFVHTQHILHLDMKPENILCLTKEGNRIKIIDFGLARKYDPEKKLQVLFGTPEFVAPEVVNFEQIGFGTDMWSIGVICYVLLSGLSPFMGDTDIETMANVTVAKYDFDDEAFADISEDAKDFIRSLLVKDKEARASASRCQAHAWLARKSPPPPKITAKPDVEKSRTGLDVGTREELDVTKDNLRLFVERWREHPDSPYLYECESSGDSAPYTINFAGNNNESISLRGQSPSPCGSLCSSDSDPPSSPGPNHNFLLSVPGGGLGFPFERRASEGTGTGHENSRDPATQIVLAEEIIKLSEHLRSIALTPRPDSSQVPPQSLTNHIPSVNTAKSVSNPESTEKTHNNDSNIETQSIPDNFDGIRANLGLNGTVNKASETRNGFGNQKHKSPEIYHNGTKAGGEVPVPDDSVNSRIKANGTVNAADSTRTNEISEKLSTIAKQRKLKGTAFNGVSKYDRNAETSSTVESCINFSSKRTSILANPQKNIGTNGNFRGTPTTHRVNSSYIQDSINDDWNSLRSLKRDSSKQTSTFLQKASKSGDAVVSQMEMDLTPPWRQGRGKPKHRFSESCRDVPRISNLRDLHEDLNLDEPKSTKDFLLQLLGEWDDANRSSGVGRSSISVDWCGEESIARRSMSSLAEYFQSEQQNQKTTSSVVSPMTQTPPQPSAIHR